MPLPKQAQVMNYQTAMKSLIDKEFIKTAKYREQQGRAERRGHWCEFDQRIGPIVRFSEAMVSDCRRRGIPMFAHCIVRSAADQMAAYKGGVSKAKPGESPHNYGLAVDLVHGVRGWDLDHRAWDIIAHIGREVSARIQVPVEWGGSWRFYDPAHWQIANWRNVLLSDKGECRSQGK